MFSTTSNNNGEIKRIVVVGAGLMGAGVVQVAAQSGFKVTMVDTNEQALDKGKQMITASLERLSKKNPIVNVDDVMRNVQVSLDPVTASKSADLVIEAIVESLQVKQQLFKQLDQSAPEHSIFVSNTSSLPITRIADATSRQDKFAGLHFFNPVPQMKLVEVIRTNDTSDSTFQSLLEVVKKMDKVAVKCKDTPGFIVNRLLVPYLMESMQMLDRGDASVEDIDNAMKLGAGYPMGPFQLADFVGLDTLKFIADGWRRDYPQSAVVPGRVECLERLVKEGKLGRKSGQGFYSYTPSNNKGKL